MDESDLKPISKKEIEPSAAGDEGMPLSNSAQSQSEIPTTPPEMGPTAPPPAAEMVSRSSAQRYWKILLFAILLLAVALRTRGLNWDEGQHLHPDERFLTMVSTAIQLPNSWGQYFDTAQSPLNPYNRDFGSFVYGTAPLFFVRFVGEIVQQTEYETIVLLGRALSALADLFVVAMTFMIGRRLYGLRVGLLAALFYAMAMMPIKQSHFFTVDTFTNVPLMLAFWFALDIAEGKRGRWAFVFAGAFFGLTLASRINLAPFAGIIALAALLRLVKSLGEVERMNVELGGRKTERTFGSSPATPSESVGAAETRPMRSFRIGPLLIEIEFKQDTVSAAASSASEAERLESAVRGARLRQVIVGLIIAAIAGVLVFRIAQPYAFEGFFGMNPQFLEDMASAQRLVSGQDDYPPSHQWTARTPYWFPWYNMVFWGLGAALGFAAWLGVGLAAVQVWRDQRREHLLILFWIMGMFLYHGRQFVMNMRYLLPLYPFLAILAAYFLFSVWDRARVSAQGASSARLATAAKFFAGMLFVIVIGSTLFLAIASTSIYARPNTRVAASRWIYANIPDGVVVANEHWDDSLPLRVDGQDYFRDHEGITLELYGEDTPEKRELMVQWMDEADYIFLSSNRLYDSIPRLPMRFPLTTKYYEWLFNGELGFEKVQEFTSYPQLLGVVINTDNAEEAYSVYDHPKVTIFRKTAAYSHDNTVRLFNSVDLTEVLRLKPIDATASHGQFKMSPAELAANRAGGTWSDLFNPNSLVNRIPLPIWIVMVWLIGALTFPFTFVIFHSFADRGYAFAKALGILFVAWFAWTLSSYRILPFNRLAILLGLAVMAAVGFLILRRYGQEMRSFVKTNLKLLLIEEVIFFSFFAIDLAIRYGNPDLWHPSFGGEKPMDIAYLNAILKTTYFPPYNPWFVGHYINYYYFGQLISASLVLLSGITPEIAYNLLIPMFFGLAASSAFGIVFNLVLSGRQRRLAEAQGQAEAAERNGLFLPAVAGVFAAILVLVMGNLGEVKLAYKALTDLGGSSGLFGFLNGLNVWLVAKQPLPIPTGDWYWTATRVIPDTINEFPFFTFLYGDLHAHMMAIPYTLVALGFAAHIALSRRQLRLPELAVIALVLGALRAINTWDYPTYMAIIGAALLLRFSMEVREQDAAQDFQWHAWLQQWLRFIVLVLAQVTLLIVPMNIIGIRVTLEVAVYLLLLLFGVVVSASLAGKNWSPYALAKTFGWRLLAMIYLSSLFFLPYILNYGTGYTSIELWKDARTTLSEYFTVHGIFLFMAATFFVVVILTDYLRRETIKLSGLELTGSAFYLLLGLIIAETVLIALDHSTFALVLPLVGLGIWLCLDPRIHAEARWVVLLMLVGLMLTLLVEVVVLKGDIGRMNTVFKFYLQAWVMFGVACAAGLALIADYFIPTRRPVPAPGEATSLSSDPSPAAQTPQTVLGLKPQWIRRAWWGVFTLLLLAGLVYPIVATRAKVNDRYVAGSPPGLNGMEYMRHATYSENNQTITLYWDYDAIQWMRQNIKGSPVIAEANTGLYHWGNRYSIYTGLPTIIGWDWHQKQQYSLLPGELIDYRLQVVRELYDTPDSNRAMEILRRYDVNYVIVGQLERAVYNPAGLAKFDQPNNMWGLVYQNEGVKIYQVFLTEE